MSSKHRVNQSIPVKATYWAQTITHWEQSIEDLGSDFDSASHFLALDCNFSRLLALYSAGENLKNIATVACRLIGEEFPKYANQFSKNRDDPADSPSHSWCLRMASMFILSKPKPDQAIAFSTAYDQWDHSESAGDNIHDHIMRYLLQFAGAKDSRFAPTGVIWKRAYGPLWQAIDPRTPDTNRVKHMTRFLKSWYGHMEEAGAAECGTHHLNTNSYVGYWCLEAAAGVVAANIDDTSFRDHPHYPAHWADYARGRTAP